VPAGARRIRVLALLTDPGRVWVDDLVLAPTDAPPTAAPVAPESGFVALARATLDRVRSAIGISR
jgi:hypothetical protein